MRPNPLHFSWASLMVSVGLAVICFSKLPKSVLADSSAPSERQLKLLSMISAKFTNEEQVNEEKANGQDTLDLMILTIYPVEVPLFGETLTYYGEEIVNGKIIRQYLAVSTENDLGLIDYKIYTVLKPIAEGPWSGGSLNDLTMKDLNYTEGCDATYSEIDEGVFLFEYPNCLNYSPEDKKTYPTVITCNVMAALIPVSNKEPEKASHVPYELKPVSRFPLPASFYAGVDNYKNPCQ